MVTGRPGRGATPVMARRDSQATDRIASSGPLSNSICRSTTVRYNPVFQTPLATRRSHGRQPPDYRRSDEYLGTEWRSVPDPSPPVMSVSDAYRRPRNRTIRTGRWIPFPGR
ncbi:hypothetical protein J6590_033695 [Homalodisca vitripennis]|nr:hypothetical protein J6590_033695 [Homalodisca vitripennis]